MNEVSWPIRVCHVVKVVFLCGNSPDSSKRCLVLSGIRGMVGISDGSELGKKGTGR